MKKILLTIAASLLCNGIAHADLSDLLNKSENLPGATTAQERERVKKMREDHAKKLSDIKKRTAAMNQPQKKTTVDLSDLELADDDVTPSDIQEEVAKIENGAVSQNAFAQVQELFNNYLEQNADGSVDHKIINTIHGLLYKLNDLLQQYVRNQSRIPSQWVDAMNSWITTTGQELFKKIDLKTLPAQTTKKKKK
jgi:signal transduction protein with GAF and PtsI domain